MRTLTGVLTGMIALNAIAMPVILGTAKIAPGFYIGTITPIAETIDAGSIILSFATVVVFCVWIHRAGKNLVDAGLDALEFTPASRIWWFFVPFANLVKPFQAMRELWNASHGTWPYDTGQSLVTTWWVLWLINGTLSNVAMRTGLPNFLWASAMVGVASAVFAVMLIRAIADAQSTLDGQAFAEVFA